MKYLERRGLTLEGDLYFDLDQQGVVFPYYYQHTFCGAQVRFLEPRERDGKEWKINTLPGTRLGLLFYGWNQGPFTGNVKYVVVTEGAFDALSIQQSMNKLYGGIAKCPWRAVACSGSGLSTHQQEVLKELKDAGLVIIGAPDSDEAGIGMGEKMLTSQCVTHMAYTGEQGKDWNDKLRELGNDSFAKFFLSRVAMVD